MRNRWRGTGGQPGASGQVAFPRPAAGPVLADWLGSPGPRRLWACAAGSRPVSAGGLREAAGAVAEQPGLGFAELLRQLRADARLTQEEQAEAAGVSSRSVSYGSSSS